MKVKKVSYIHKKIAKRLFLLSESFLKVSQKKFPSPCYKLGKKLTCCNYLPSPKCGYHKNSVSNTN